MYARSSPYMNGALTSTAAAMRSPFDKSENYTIFCVSIQFHRFIHTRNTEPYLKPKTMHSMFEHAFLLHTLCMKLDRLRGRKINERVIKRGILWKGKTLTAKWLSGPPPHPEVNPTVRALYVGTAASSKLDKSAVNRNRMRRRCREALRTAVQGRSDLPTVQLLLSPRSSSLRCDFRDIQADISALLSTLR